MKPYIGVGWNSLRDNLYDNLWDSLWGDLRTFPAQPTQEFTKKKP